MMERQSSSPIGGSTTFGDALIFLAFWQKFTPKKRRF
jgi:hypothetical protein